ncbi:hypothetical protein M0R45_025880 [Rubus argutus]|uniref:Uncharacterized protein n=1 Tax=Rubus argutus TaxID=59490 RepID=A0AAW1WVC0_RUBAR
MVAGHGGEAERRDMASGHNLGSQGRRYGFDGGGVERDQAAASCGGDAWAARDWFLGGTVKCVGCGLGTAAATLW